MGALRFHVVRRNCLPEAVLERVYVTGLDGTAWVSRSRWDGDVLVIERAEHDSGNVHVPVLFSGLSMGAGSGAGADAGASSDASESSTPGVRLDLGERTVSTACLMEREQPYLLEVELARGTLNQLRNQIAAWHQVGMAIPEEVREQLARATGAFAAAATLQTEPATAASRALEALRQAVEATDRLGESYTQQAISVRRRHTATLPTLVGANLGNVVPAGETESLFCDTFTITVIPAVWRRIEPTEGQREWDLVDAQVHWCQKHRQKICSGPLLRFDVAGTPDWLYLWEGDYESLAGFMLDHVKAVIERYRGRFQVWQIAARVNLGGSLSLTEQQSLSIVARAVELARGLDPQTPIVISFDQPWAEYMASRDAELSPMQLADTLVRAELGLAGLGIEINAGYHPEGSGWYGLLEYSQILDRWSVLGLPLVMLVSSPSSGVDFAVGSKSNQERASANSSKSREQSRDGNGVETKPAPLMGNGVTDGSERQAQWVRRYLPMMLAKNCVQMVIWNQLFDSPDLEYPHGGLFDSQGAAKPALAAVREARRSCLGTE